MKALCAVSLLSVLAAGCLATSGCQELVAAGATSTSAGAEVQQTLWDGTPVFRDIKPAGVDPALVGTWCAVGPDECGVLLTFNGDGTMSYYDEGMVWDTASSADGPLVRVGYEGGELTPFAYNLEGDTLMMPDPWGGTGAGGPVLTFQRTRLGGDDRLLGGWSYETSDSEGSGYVYLGFYADGTLDAGASYQYFDPEMGEEGDGIAGYWSADGSTIRFLNGGWIELPYTIKGDTLTMPAPDDPGGPVYTYHWDGTFE